jgi:hypothetical protein
VEIADLPCAGRPVRVTEYLIDAEHSNSHTAAFGRNQTGRVS